MAVNPIQLVLQQMMQQATQNPQMLMQLVSTQPVQSILETLLSPQQLKNETTSFSGYQNATPMSPALGGGSPYPIGSEDDPDHMNAALANELMDDKQRMAPHMKKPYFDIEEQRNKNEEEYPVDMDRGFYPGV